MLAPSRYTRYPATPALSVEASQAIVTEVVDVLVNRGFPGAEGPSVSGLGLHGDVDVVAWTRLEVLPAASYASIANV